VRFDRLSLVLLNVLAASRILPGDPWLTNTLSVLFLIRVTLALRDASLVVGGAKSMLSQPSTLPAART